MLCCLVMGFTDIVSQIPRELSMLWEKKREIKSGCMVEAHILKAVKSVKTINTHYNIEHQYIYMLESDDIQEEFHL